MEVNERELAQNTLAEVRNNCHCINEIVSDLEGGKGVPREEFHRLLILLNGSSVPEAADYLIEEYAAEDEKEECRQALEKYRVEDFKPCRCAKFDCTQEDVERCFGKANTCKKLDGEIIVKNTPADFIKRRKLEQAIKIEQAHEKVEDAMDIVLDGDSSYLGNEDVIEAFSILYSEDNVKYQKYIDELKKSKVPITDLKKAVEKGAKKRAKEEATGQREMTPATIDDVPDVVKPYYDNLANVDTEWLSKDGYIHTSDKDGNDVLVSNAVPIIEEKLIVDGGLNKEVYYKISVVIRNKEILDPIIVSANEFKSATWFHKRISHKAILFQNSYYESVRRLVQILAETAPICTVIESSGWKNVGTDEILNHVFCYSGGYLGGNADEIKVKEMNELRGYNFVPDVEELKECYEAYQTLETLIPERKEIMLALISHAFGSVLVHKLDTESIMPKHLIWLYGCSGSFKTSVALVILSLFGLMENPPATFNDTTNSIEKKMYLAKDSLLLVDDYCPASTIAEANQKNSKASIVTRGIGDRIGKARAGSNMVLRPEYRPRGNVLVTGEDCPTGFSTTSRHISIALNRGDVDVNKLTWLQNNGHLLNSLMVYFILWVKEAIMDNPECKLKPRIIEVRDEASNSNHHRRFAMSVAHLQLGYEILMKFFVEKEILSQEEANEKCQMSLQAYKMLAEEQNRLMANEDVADKFMTALAEMISTRTIEPKNVDLPKTILNNNVLCYDDDENYYFVPSSTFAEVIRFYQQKNEPIMMTERMMWKMLDDKKYLIRMQVESESDRHAEYKLRKNIGEKQMRVVGIKKSLLDTF